MAESQKKQAWVTSLRLLAASPKSRKELAFKLTDKGYEEGVIQEILDNLERQGILSDRSYGRNLVARFVQGQPSGRRKIAFELKRHGLPSSIQEELLGELNPEEEIARAEELAGARWERLKNFPIEKRRKRVYDFLIRRGFDFQIVRDILEKFEHA